MSPAGHDGGVDTKVLVGVVAALAGSAVIAVLFMLIMGGRGLIDGPSTHQTSPAEPTQADTPAVQARTDEPPAVPIPTTPARQRVTLRVEPDSQARPRSTYAELVDGQVVQIEISRDGPSRGTIVQCVIQRRNGVDHLSACGNVVPVWTGEDGSATALYQMVDTGRCGQRDRCVIAVRFAGDDEIADAFIVFGDEAPEFTVEIDPTGPHLDGDELLVHIGAATPGAAVSVRLCGESCTDPIVGEATSEGTLSTTIEIDDECRRCEVLVSAGPRERRFPLLVAEGPGAVYSWSRLLAGLVAATLFLAAAVVVARRTDWRPPSEAATPAFDGPWRWDELLDEG